MLAAADSVLIGALVLDDILSTFESERNSVRRRRDRVATPSRQKTTLTDNQMDNKCE